MLTGSRNPYHVVYLCSKALLSNRLPASSSDLDIIFNILINLFLLHIRFSLTHKKIRWQPLLSSFFRIIHY